MFGTVLISGNSADRSGSKDQFVFGEDASFPKLFRNYLMVIIIIIYLRVM